MTVVDNERVNAKARRYYKRAKQRYAYMTIRLPYEDKELLRQQAKKNKLPMVEQLRTYLIWGIEQEEQA